MPTAPRPRQQTAHPPAGKARAAGFANHLSSRQIRAKSAEKQRKNENPPRQAVPLLSSRPPIGMPLRILILILILILIFKRRTGGLRLRLGLRLRGEPPLAAPAGLTWQAICSIANGRKAPFCERLEYSRQLHEI
jgi:hypothetical protein